MQTISEVFVIVKHNFDTQLINIITYITLI